MYFPHPTNPWLSPAVPSVLTTWKSACHCWILHRLRGAGFSGMKQRYEKKKKRCLCSLFSHKLWRRGEAAVQGADKPRGGEVI